MLYVSIYYIEFYIDMENSVNPHCQKHADLSLFYFKLLSSLYQG